MKSPITKEPAAVAAELRRNSQAKEPVKIRFRKLAGGSLSVYLAINLNGRRTYEYPRLYLVPESDMVAREQNRLTMEAAYTIKARRIVQIASGIAGFKKDVRQKMPLTEWLGVYRDRQVGRGRASAGRWVQTVLYALRGYTAERSATLADIDRRWLSDFMYYLLNGYTTSRNTRLSKGSVDNYMRCLKAALNMAVEEGTIPANPIRGVDRTHLHKATSHREYLTVAEVKRLADAPCRARDIKEAFLFACFCGLRISDIRALRWRNVVCEGGRWHIDLYQRKTGQPLYLPLNRQALRWLPDRGDAADDGAVFGRLPKNMTVLSRWVREAGIGKHVTFHVSRHTFATMALTMGADIYTTSKLLGHTEVRTTQIYARIVNSKKEEAVALLDTAFDQ